ncbi:hypothetical protein [Caballeronia sp. LZ035]|uniref:hypothetical protein n=1 Tax=Caballeronia sp. LZ035 TaxID=3038568 RepID=UPI002856124D|nr:hypothetical protein [Caballeronia sp. LZ035]MDR5756895.1 hypothetical protein [Caballeronia sp. LZ035]
MTTPRDFYNVAAQVTRMALSKYYAERIASRAASVQMVLRCVVTRKRAGVFPHGLTGTAMQVLHHAM